MRKERRDRERLTSLRIAEAQTRIAQNLAQKPATLPTPLPTKVGAKQEEKKCTP